MQKSEIRILVGEQPQGDEPVQLSGIKVLNNPDTPTEPTFYAAFNDKNEIVRSLMINPEDRATTGVAIGTWAASGYRVERMSYKAFVKHMRVQTAPKEPVPPAVTVEVLPGHAPAEPTQVPAAAPGHAATTGAARVQEPDEPF